ncbi:hypothetical protein EON80_31140 [bacterium]|nr:MAG: hypothetical protein EON80_31140 [bacterium]
MGGIWLSGCPSPFLARWPEFGAGMLAAHFIARRDSLLASRKSTPLGSWQVLLCAAVVLFALAFVSPRYPVLSLITETLFGLVALLVLLAASNSANSNSNWVRAFLENKALVRFGTVSYSFYLIHQPLLKLVLSLQWVQGLRADYRFILCMLVVFPVLLLVASVFFHFIEKPFAKSANSRPLLSPTFH